MTCSEVSEKLVEIWGDSDAMCEAMREHLAECGECREEAMQLARTHALITSVQAERAPEGFRARVIARLAETPRESLAWHERILTWLRPEPTTTIPAWGRAGAVAAICVILVGSLTFIPDQFGPSAVTNDATIIAAGHGAGAAASNDELEALVFQHRMLELDQALSDDAGVTLVSYKY